MVSSYSYSLDESVWGELSGRLRSGRSFIWDREVKACGKGGEAHQAEGTVRTKCTDWIAGVFWKSRKLEGPLERGGKSLWVQLSQLGPLSRPHRSLAHESFISLEDPVL